MVGQLLTAASVSPGVSLGQVAFSLTVFTLLYGALAVVEVVLLVRAVQAGPPPPAAPAGPEPSGTSAPVATY